MDTAAFRHDFFLILPEVELALFGLAILLFDFMLGVKDKAGNAVFAMLGVIFSGISLYRLRGWGRTPWAASTARSWSIRSSCFSG